MQLTLPAELQSLLEKPDEMGRPEKPITQTDLEEFERSQGVVLPPSYKDYCLRYGSRALQNRKIYAFKTKVMFTDRKSKKADVGSISGPPYILETYQRYMDPIYNNSGPRLPEHVYPFTFDDGYGHCLVDLNKETYGRVLYIVIRAKTFGDTGYGWDQIGVVADDFQGFLDGLTPDFL
ncbi:SMI1/KNR4 family protein [Agrobacterium sp. CG674]